MILGKFPLMPSKNGASKILGVEYEREKGWEWTNVSGFGDY